MNKIHLRNETIYRELTPTGMFFCACIGLIVEFIIFFITGIKPLLVSIPVLLFLWLLSSIIVHGIFHAVTAFADLQEVPLTYSKEDDMISENDILSLNTISHFVA